MAIFKSLQITNAADSREKEPSYTVDGNATGAATLGEQYGGFFKKLRIESYHVRSSNPTPRHAISGKDENSNLK